MITFRIMIITGFLILLFSIVGCVSTEHIGDIVKEGTEGVAKIQLANSAKTMADTGKIKAQTNANFLNLVDTSIAKQPLDAQAKLLKQAMDAKVTVSKNTLYKGRLEGILFLLFIIFFSKAIRWLLNKWKPVATETTTKYANK